MRNMKQLTFNSDSNKFKKLLLALLAVVVVQVLAAALSLFTSVPSYAASVRQVSTGETSACAVADSKLKCWGDNSNGQLGFGSTGGTKTSPVAVADNKDPIAEVSKCNAIFFNPCGSKTIISPAVAASALANKEVRQVSVGKAHACAIANAAVYCWGDNSKGQLGNRTNTDSSVPVAVDIQSTDVTPAPVKPNPCGGWFQPSCTPVAQPTKPKSALGSKEIIDISAGDYYTCALASDGTVACWGEGDNGRLGTNATTDSNYPKAVYTGNGSALAGKKAIKLAKSSAATMCAIAVDANSTTYSSGQAYCWGYGVDDGTSLPANSTSTVTCSKTSPVSAPSNASSTTIFSSLKPTKVNSSELLTALDDSNYVTAQSTSGRAYYWGMYGYVKNVVYSNITTCKYNCTGAKVGIITDVRLSGYSTSGTRTTHTGGSTNTNHYQGKATPGTKANGGLNSGGGGGGSCAVTTRHGYTTTTTYQFTGKNTATTPPSWPQSQGGATAVSGNVYNGLYCSATGTGASCDTHGTSATEGQTGSGYSQTCTTSGGFLGFGATTTCTPPAPVGPQQVVGTAWPAGKSVKSLSTGSTGYTCGVTTDGELGCWGMNNKGQLGVGDTANKNVPTKVNI